MKKNRTAPHAETSPALLERREFLALGTVAVVGVAASAAAGPLGKVAYAVAANEPAPVLSAGFAEATAENLRDATFVTRLAAASGLRSGDPALADAVLVRFKGLVQPPSASEAGVNLAIDVLYRLPGNLHQVPFLAWSHARLPHPSHRELSSGSSPFVVPVGANHPLSLAVTTTNMASGKMMSCGTLKLGVGNGRNEAKLRRGVYVIAVVPPGKPAPDWSSIQVSGSDTGMPGLRQNGLAALSAAPFDYVVVVTDYA